MAGEDVGRVREEREPLWFKIKGRVRSRSSDVFAP
jgi:hypothetical protein